MQTHADSNHPSKPIKTQERRMRHFTSKQCLQRVIFPEHAEQTYFVKFNLMSQNHLVIKLKTISILP